MVSYCNFKINDYVLNTTLDKKGYIIDLMYNNIDEHIYYLEYIDGTNGYADNKELEYIRQKIELI